MTIEQKQHLLAYLGYYLGKVDGIWGPRSARAATDFQEDFGGIAVDGIVGPETEKALKHAVAYGMPEKLVQEETAPTEDAQTETVQEVLIVLFTGIRHWKPEEFACRCGEYHDPYCNGFPVLPDRTLLELVDDIRDVLGVPCHRSSGIRCRQHNIDSNGAVNSRHLSGKALDFCAEGYTAQQVVNIINGMKDSRVRYCYAIDGSYVHVDVQ